MAIIDKRLFQPRPKRILALHVADREVEYLWARRQGRGWKLGPSRKAEAQGESTVFDVLRGLPLAPEGRAPAALAVFLSLPHYAMHRELYPLALKDDLDKAIAFDWQENSLLEEGRSAVFSGDPVAGEDQIAVPIFSIGSDFLEKLEGAVRLSAFRGFTIIPSALGFQKLAAQNGQGRRPAALGGPAGAGRLEMHLFNEGGLLESTLIQPGSVSLRLFREKLEAMAEEEGGDAAPVAAVLCPDGCPAASGFALDGPDSPMRRKDLGEPLLSAWTKRFLEEGVFRGHGQPIDLRPFRLPREAAAVLALVALVLLLGAWTAYENEALSDELLQLRVQKKALDAKLAPQEEAQRRIDAIRAGEKARQGFREGGVPALDVIRLLTEQTPDEAWYNYMTLKDGQITLQGEATSTVRLITLLSKIEGFEEVRLSSPVRNNPSSGKERFSLQIKLNQAALRQSLQAGRGVPAQEQGAGQGPEQSASQPPSRPAGQEPGGPADGAAAGARPAAKADAARPAKADAAQPAKAPQKAAAPRPADKTPEAAPSRPSAATSPDIMEGLEPPPDGAPATPAGRPGKGSASRPAGQAAQPSPETPPIPEMESTSPTQ